MDAMKLRNFLMVQLKRWLEVNLDFVFFPKDVSRKIKHFKWTVGSNTALTA
jgi:hypothetical protein